MSWPMSAPPPDPRDVSDPREAAGKAGDKIFGEIQASLHGLETPSWSALQGRISALETEAGAAVGRLGDYRRLPDRYPAAAAFDADVSMTKAKLSGLQQEATALANQLKAELTTGARPKVNSEREGFVRQDVANLLEGAGPDLARQLLDLARGSHRDRAAVALSDFTDAHLARVMPDASQRAAFRQALDSASLDGAITHGTVVEKRYAQAAKDAVKVQSWLATRIQPALGRLRDAEAMRP